MIVGLFWSSLAAVAGTYVLFPAATLVRSFVAPRPYQRGAVGLSVTVVIAAHNEEATIGRKLDSVLGSRYDGAMDVVVVTDGCTDRTASVVAGYAHRGVRLLELPRVGKHAALNAAVRTSRAEVLIFSDANGELAVDAVAKLVSPLADPEVGGVAGDQRYRDGGADDGVADGERSYWSFDRRLKRAESRAGNVVSATGALYAVRRELFQTVVSGVTDDFYVSTGVIAAGRRLVFADDAVVYEPPASSAGKEYGRKVRVMTRGLQGVVERRELLDPRRTGYYSVQLLAHKVLRRLMFVPLSVMAVTGVLAARRSPLLRLMAAGQIAGALAGAAGLALGRTSVRCPRALSLPAYFCLVNVAAAQAVLNVLTGRRIDRWATARDETGG